MVVLVGIPSGRVHHGQASLVSIRPVYLMGCL